MYIKCANKINLTLVLANNTWCTNTDDKSCRKESSEEFLENLLKNILTKCNYSSALQYFQAKFRWRIVSSELTFMFYSVLAHLDPLKYKQFSLKVSASLQFAGDQT